MAQLGEDSATDEDDVLWWQRTTRVGSVAKAWPGSGWQARHSTGRQVTIDPVPASRATTMSSDALTRRVPSGL